MSNQFTRSYVIYKPKKDGSGSASQWNISGERDCLFLEMSSQNGKNESGNPKFDWDNKIIFKLSESDIGEILAVLSGKQAGIGPFSTERGKHKGLFHSNQRGNAILGFARDESKACFKIYLSAKRDGDKTACAHNITNGEACILETLLRRSVEILYKWD